MILLRSNKQKVRIFKKGMLKAGIVILGVLNFLLIVYNVIFWCSNDMENLKNFDIRQLKNSWSISGESSGDWLAKDLKSAIRVSILDFLQDGGCLQNHEEFRICKETVDKELTEVSKEGKPLSAYVEEVIEYDDEFIGYQCQISQEGQVSVDKIVPE